MRDEERKLVVDTLTKLASDVYKGQDIALLEYDERRDPFMQGLDGRPIRFLRSARLALKVSGWDVEVTMTSSRR